MADPTNSLQKAIYEALTLGSPSPVAAGVYDHVPEDSASFPFVVIDAQEVVQADYMTERMDERFVYLSVWSRERGKKQVQTLLAQIDAALHRQRLTLDTGSCISCEIIRKRVAMDADGLTYMGNVTVKIRTAH